MSSAGRVSLVGFGAVLGAALVLSGCSGQQYSASGVQPATTSTAVSAATTTAPATSAATTIAPATIAPATNAPATNASADACASATKATLTAALKANKQISGALVIDSKGLQDIKCAAPWAIAP